MASTSKCAIIGGTTTLVEYVVVDVAHKGESVVEAFNEAKAGLEASSVAVSVVLALQVNGWNQDAKAGLEELVKEQVLISCLLCRLFESVVISSCFSRSKP